MKFSTFKVMEGNTASSSTIAKLSDAELGCFSFKEIVHV